MEIVTDYLINKISYEVPEQDVGYSMVKVPTIPNSGIKLENIDYIG